ncbi:unnamed protein product [Rotaria sordida]|uniref:Uncharacterized protein n=1 Tax=Rotaria sordida TaxID=392033 RepID=A0A813RA55_9BILA|nr:unnamed protein product [Rotaria sordida]CAF0745216.1 unnamed protein product [Rotaria sordida]CAF0780692.1 unnamed protein product [Rotaria sordida]CAF0814216.1 unnamed protein product [Rotaria sordida]CAF3486248.1 unnamed protein product [Rotaria sordida]
MSTLCRFVLPTTLSTIEEACVAEFNEYKKRMKEISHNKSSNKRFTTTTGGITTNLTNTHDSSHHQKDPIRNPEQAKEVAKKLVQSGAIKVQAQGKDHGFKRATSSNAGQERLVKKMSLTPNTPSSSQSISNQTNPFQSIPFVSPNSTPKFVNTNSHENKRLVVNYDDTDNY